MPVLTRRTRGTLRGFAAQPPLRRARQTVVNSRAPSVTSQTNPNTEPTVQTVPTVSDIDSNSNRTHNTNTIKDPKITRFSGTNDDLKVEPFLNIFDRYFGSLDDLSKVLKLGEYLSGDALNFFGTDIITDEFINWTEAKSRLLRRYGHSDVPPMLAAVRRPLQKHETIKQYFDEKCSHLRQEKGLSESARTQLLTEGLPDVYRQHFYGKRFTSTTEWLQTAQDIEADLNRHNRYPTHTNSSAHVNRTDSLPNKHHFKSKSNHKESRPPYPCRHCRDKGITAHHWHNDCPNKPVISRQSELKSQSANPETQLSFAEALVVPLSTSDDPILVKTYIKNMKVMAFVDTGANVNLMPESVVYEFRLVLDRTTARPVKTASGFAQTIGSVTFPLTINGKTQTISALVISGFDYTLLLSRTTCHLFKLVIDTDLMRAEPKTTKQCHMTSGLSLSTNQSSVSETQTPSMPLKANPTYNTDYFVRELVDKFSHLFASDSTDLGRIDIEKHKIVLTDDQPVAQRPYRQSIRDAEETDRQVKDLLAKGLIRESTSPYAAPVTLADKKDNTKRLCIDYRRLNHKTISDKTPLPLIADVLDRLQGSKVFTKLDFCSGYWQVPVNEEDIHKTAFVTTNGHYESLVLPFGLKNSPATFHRVVQKIIGDLLNHGVMSYLDDIVIYAKERSEHDQLLTQVFERLS